MMKKIIVREKSVSKTNEIYPKPVVDWAAVVVVVLTLVFVELMADQQTVEPDFRLNLVAMLFDLVLLLPLLVSNLLGD